MKNDWNEYTVTVVYRREISEDADYIPCLKGSADRKPHDALASVVADVDAKTLAIQLASQCMDELQEAADVSGLPCASWRVARVSVKGEEFDVEELFPGGRSEEQLLAQYG